MNFTTTDRMDVVVSCAIAFLLLATVGQARADSRTRAKIVRFAANFLLFDGREISATSTDDTTSPIHFYGKTVKIPAQINVLYIRLDGTGEGTGQTLLGCKVDGAPCNPGTGAAAGEPGFVTVQVDGVKDSSINAVWCTPIARLDSTSAGLFHTVDLFLASDGTGPVFMESIHVFVDGNRISNSKNRCKEMVPLQGIVP